MASIILTGATGTAGSDALRQAIKSPWIAQISVLSRRALPDADLQNHPKVNFIEHSDFLHYPPELLKRLEGHSACIWDLGITSVGIKEEAYRRITTEYAVEAAKAFSSLTDGNPESFSFVYLSGQGAAWRPGFLTQMFGKVKGEAELGSASSPAKAIQLFAFTQSGLLSSTRQTQSQTCPSPCEPWLAPSMLASPLAPSTSRVLTLATP